MTKAIILLPFLILTACDSGPEVKMENASISDVAKEMGKAREESFVNPGKWQQVVTLVDISAPGMPPEVANAMRKSVGQKQSSDTCLTEAQAKSPKEDFFAGANKNCRFDHFKWGGGKVDLKLDCKHSAATQTMVLTGTYQPENYAMAMTATTVGATPAERMVMKMKVDAKRIGACTPAENGRSRRGDEESGALSVMRLGTRGQTPLIS